MAITNKSQVPVPPPGVHVPVPTFFKNAPPSGRAEVDVETQVAHAIHTARNGVHGLVLLGSTGEAIHLSREERINLVRNVRSGLDEAGFTRYPILVGILTNSDEDALHELRVLNDAGGDWGLVLVPGYFGGVIDQSNIIDWFTKVADQSPMPILMYSKPYLISYAGADRVTSYNYPGVTNGVIVKPETYFTLAAHWNIVGCKMSHGNMSHHIQVALAPQIDHSKFRLYTGFGQQSYPVVSCGGAGVIDGLAAVFPRVVAELFDTENLPPPIDAARLEKIRTLQWNVSRGNELLGQQGVIGIREAAIRELQIGSLGAGRAPLAGKMPKGVWEGWNETFENLRKLEAFYPSH